MLLSATELAVIGLSLRVATVAVLASLPFGIAMGWLLARKRFPGKALLDALVHLPLVLPPVVIGYMLLVSRGEAPLGVVYASDAKADPGVRVLATFPAGTHPKIVYPVARVAASRNPQATAFVHWLQSADADAIFRKHGFSVR